MNWFIAKLSRSIVTAGYILLLPMWLLNFLLRGMRRIPLIVWILLIPMVVFPPQAVLGLPDTADNGAVFPTVPVVVAAAAATATFSIANQPP